MNVFDLRDRLVGDYSSYTRSSIKIADPRILHKVDSDLKAGAFWPEPLLQLNPTFLPGGTIDELVADGTLHPECARIFRIDKSDTDHTGKQIPRHPPETARNWSSLLQVVLGILQQLDLFERGCSERLAAWRVSRYLAANGLVIRGSNLVRHLRRNSAVVLMTLDADNRVPKMSLDRILAELRIG